MDSASFVSFHDVTAADGSVIAPELLQRSEAVHRQLRPNLPGDYLGKMKRVFEDGGRMCVAVSAGGSIVGVAVYRIYEDTLGGTHLNVDDLITNEADRSKGIGAAFLAHLEAIAQGAGCWSLTLDSGVQRERAHAFYLREGMTFVSKLFAKKLGA